MTVLQDPKLWAEADYRKCVQETFGVIAAQFEEVDPDQAECELAFGVLTISFPNRTKVILSAQPSVRQLWVAMAAKGTAVHFNYDSEKKQWLDDKGRGVELMSLMQQVLKESAGVELWQKK